jgi:hypothetical protein
MGTALSFPLKKYGRYSVVTEPYHFLGYPSLAADAYAFAFGDSSTVQWQADQPIPGNPAFSDTMGPGETMHKGESRVSHNNQYELILQPDGDLVLYEKLTDFFPFENPGKLWSSHTNGKNVDRVVMGADGNLVMYSPPSPRQRCSDLICDDSSIWESGTGGHSGSHLKVEGDDNAGFAKIYDQNSSAVWVVPSSSIGNFSYP